MRSSFHKILLVVLLAAAGAAVVFALGGDGGEAEAPQIGEMTAPEQRRPARASDGGPAPDFSMGTVDGDTFRLADHAGKVVVLNFWATWCAPCLVEIPDLIAMQEELSDDGVQFVGLSMDEQADSVVAGFAEDTGMNYPVLVDDGSVSRQYGGIYALPTTIVVGPDGMIRFRKAGLITKEELMPLLTDLAAG